MTLFCMYCETIVPSLLLHTHLGNAVGQPFNLALGERYPVLCILVSGGCGLLLMRGRLKLRVQTCMPHALPYITLHTLVNVPSLQQPPSPARSS
jgi:hypothetical protein